MGSGKRLLNGGKIFRGYVGKRLTGVRGIPEKDFSGKTLLRLNRKRLSTGWKQLVLFCYIREKEREGSGRGKGREL